MRRFHLILLFASALLAACGRESSGPRIDFIADGRTLTSDRVVTQPGDTFEVRVFAEARNNEPLLRRVTIGAQESYFVPDVVPDRVEDPERPYFQATPNAKTFLFTHRFGTSTNSGQQVWTYTAEDQDGRRATRRLRFTVRQPDSASNLHTYTVRLQAPLQRTSRAALAAVRGYVLPPHATDTAAYQELTDLLYVPTATGPSLAAPSATEAAGAPQFRVSRRAVRRATRLTVTDRNKAAFDAVTTTAALGAIVTEVAPGASSTPALRAEQVVAFITADGRPGLLYISAIGTTPPFTMTVNVKVQRR